MDMASLHIADSRSWHEDPGYSRDVARALRRAYAVLRVGRRDLRNYIAAYKCVQPHLNHSMARQQYLRAAYIMAMSHSAVGDLSEAIGWCDEALALAEVLDMPSACLDLLYLRGQCYRALLRLRDSAADHRKALGIYRHLVSRGELPGKLSDDTLEMDLLTQLAGAEFYLGEYITVRQRLDDAMTIRRRTKIEPLTGVMVDWMEALLYRWSQQPARALQPALVAAQVHTELGTPASAARIQLFTADVQLDLADAFPLGSDRDGQIAAAGEHVLLAQELAEEAHDEVGSNLALLTEIRYSRMAGENERRVSLIEEIIHAARRLGDTALLVQAYTNLGDELVALRRPDAALDCYQQSLDIVAGGELMALAAWSQRALHHAREQRGD